MVQNLEIILPFVSAIFFLILFVRVKVVSTEVKQNVTNNGAGGAGGAGGSSVFGGAGGGGGGGGGGETTVQYIGTVNSKDKLLHGVVSMAGTLISLVEGIIKLINL